MSLRLETFQALWGFLPLAALLGFMAVHGFRTGTFSYRRFILCAVAFTCCIIGLARPQGGHYASQQRGLRGDIYLAVDISRSMRAQDISPSRLEFATAFVRRLLREVPGLRVAIFPFAGDGYLQMPLSTDVDAAADLISSLSPSLTTNQGTAFETALETLFGVIQKAKANLRAESAPTRVLLLSDGETHENLAPATLEKFRSHSIPIDTVGVGTQGGAAIPVEGRNGFGRDNLRDSSGNVVRTKLETQSLRKIADGTGGNYYGPQFEQVEIIASRILRGMEFGKLNITFKLEKEYFPFFFLAALLLFAFDFLFGRWNYLVRVVVAAFLLQASPAFAWSPDVDNRLGNNPDTRPYNAYDEAIQMSKRGQMDEAAELFQEAAGTATDPLLKKRALYNLGNTLVKLQDPTQALNAYQRAYDTKSGSAKSESETNQMISDNILLAKKQKQQQKQQQQEQEGEGEGQSQQPPPDPGKAKQFQTQTLDDAQKKRFFDLVASEEQQVLQRLQQGKNSKNAPDPRGKEW